jgi:hypothetical protein
MRRRRRVPGSSAMNAGRVLHPGLGGAQAPLWPVLPASAEDRQLFGRNQEFDAPRDPGLSSDQADSLEAEHHLVDSRRADFEVSLHVRLGGSPTMQTRVGVDEGQILALLSGEARLWRTLRHQHTVWIVAAT